MNRAKQWLAVVMAALAVISDIRAQDAELVTYEKPVPGTLLKFKMIAVKGGLFTMGAVKGDKNAAPDEGPAKQVSLSAFYIGAFEVTYDEYDAFFRDEGFSRNVTTDAITRPSPPYIDLTLAMGKEGGFPANSMSHYGALMYCRWLYKKTGEFYRLPTEAEWEYACRAGSSTIYPFGNDASGLTKYAWYKTDSDNKYHKVGEKAPNAWGIYDMLGNVAEWTLDQYDEKYFNNPVTASKDPLVLPTARHPRTVKGGSYQDVAKDLRSSARLKSNLDWNRRDPQIPRSRWWNADAPFIGFRLVRPAKKPSDDEIEKFFADYIDNF
ncbi:MAG: SUMF1/EgtB/PvdO family nonheme iron enzyme [Chitinophagaceae bacterium]